MAPFDKGQSAVPSRSSLADESQLQSDAGERSLYQLLAMNGAVGLLLAVSSFVGVVAIVTIGLIIAGVSLGIRPGGPSHRTDAADMPRL